MYVLLYFGIWNDCQVEVWVYIVFSLHTHTLYSGLSCLELEGIMYQCHGGCTSQVVIGITLTRVCLLPLYFHFFLFTNYHGKCHEMGHNSSDLDL